MSQPPNSGMNGHRINDRHPGKNRSRPAPFVGNSPNPIAPRSRRSLNIGLFISIGLATVLAIGIIFSVQSTFSRLPTQSNTPDSFRLAVNEAINAADLTQVATSREEWYTVTVWWENAIALMASVPHSHPNYSVAETKISEYQRNLGYAQAQLTQAPIDRPASPYLWTPGSRRWDILRIQGEPSRRVSYESLCKEILYYGRSSVEIVNGRVTHSENFDANLRVSEGRSTSPLLAPDTSIWTLGSSRDDVFAVQGTPNQIQSYTASNQEVLYYNGSSVTLTQGQVTGYNNSRQNLRVSVIPLVPISLSQGEFWQLNSEREHVFAIQGTPTSVVPEETLCTETLGYGNSTVEINNGLVRAYNNVDRNLQIQVH